MGSTQTNPLAKIEVESPNKRNGLSQVEVKSPKKRNGLSQVEVKSPKRCNGKRPGELESSTKWSGESKVEEGRTKQALEIKKAQSRLKTGPFCFAGWTGLEPAASGVTGRRYNQLNYHPKVAWRLFNFVGATGIEPVTLGL